MAVEQEARSRLHTNPGAAVCTPAGDRFLASPAVQSLLDALPEGSARSVASSPMRLDLMGGSATYTGSFSVNYLLSDRATVATARRCDDTIWIGTINCAAELVTTTHKTSQLNGTALSRNGSIAHSNDASERAFSASDTVFATLSAIGDGVAHLQSGQGLSVCVHAPHDTQSDLGQAAAVASATIASVCGSLAVSLDNGALARIAERVGLCPALPQIAPTDIVSMLKADVGTLIQLQSKPPEVAGTLLLPEELAIVGVDSGVSHAHTSAKYVQARTSVAMGTALVDRIVLHDDWHDLGWDGNLARLSVTDYVERFRDRLPTKVNGQQFAERFGATKDPMAVVNPNEVYKLRSRTEHHIYEHFRSLQFVPCIARGIRNRDERALREAGELMYGSHWSYGQRCGLGSIETDLLVNLIRRQGSDAGIYGAKISGWGCGGAVCIFMRNTDAANAALEAAIDAYQQKSGNPARRLTADSAGDPATVVVRL